MNEKKIRNAKNSKAASWNPDPTRKYRLEVTEETLRTLIRALECYSRLGINQFSYCLEHNPAYASLDYVVRDQAEKYLRTITGTHSANLGICHPTVTQFKDAYDIRKEIEKHVSLVCSGGLTNPAINIYDGALDPDRSIIPKFIDERGHQQIKNEKVINIPKKYRPWVREMIRMKRFNELWAWIDKNIKIPYRANSTRISEDGERIIMTNPYRLSTDAI